MDENDVEAFLMQVELQWEFVRDERIRRLPPDKRPSDVFIVKRDLPIEALQPIDPTESLLAKIPHLASLVRKQDKRARHAEAERDAYDKRIEELEAQKAPTWLCESCHVLNRQNAPKCTACKSDCPELPKLRERVAELEAEVAQLKKNDLQAIPTVESIQRELDNSPPNQNSAEVIHAYLVWRCAPIINRLRVRVAELEGERDRKDKP